MIDIESLEEIQNNEFDCPICMNRFPKNIENDRMKIECSSKKHDLCNECMMRWIKESIERNRDVKCVICNEIIYRFQFHLHQQRMQNRIEQVSTESRTELNQEEGSRDIMERSVYEINQSFKKLACLASIGFIFFFGVYLCLPPHKQVYLIRFFIFYISIVLLISTGLYLNRLYYIFRLHQMNRIHPEITI
jgi:hypothetical protein